MQREQQLLQGKEMTICDALHQPLLLQLMSTFHLALHVQMRLMEQIIRMRLQRKTPQQHFQDNMTTKSAGKTL
jgi:hypothetical protein